MNPHENNNPGRNGGTIIDLDEWEAPSKDIQKVLVSNNDEQKLPTATTNDNDYTMNASSSASNEVVAMQMAPTNVVPTEADILAYKRQSGLRGGSDDVVDKDVDLEYKHQLLSRSDQTRSRTHQEHAINQTESTINPENQTNGNSESTRQSSSTEVNNNEIVEIDYKDQVNARSENRRQQHPVNRNVAKSSNVNRNDNKLTEQEMMMRPRLNISELVVHYGTGNDDNNENTNINPTIIMHENHEWMTNKPMEDSNDKSILPIAAEVVETPPLAVATPIRKFTKKQIAVMLVAVALVIVIVVVVVVVVPTLQPTTPQKCFQTNKELRNAVNSYFSNDKTIRPTYGNSIGSWCVSNVTDMSYVMSDVWFFNEDISHWDVSKVTNMSYMFYTVTEFIQDLSQWNVSNVRDMSSMFSQAYKFNQSLSNWDVANVNNMSYMFYNASFFNDDISTWDVSKVINMDGMFQFASSFNQDLCLWDTKLSNLIYGNDVFLETNCPNTSDPLSGSFCHVC